MEHHENQQCLQDPFTGYFSSLLSQEYKVSRTDHLPHPGFVLEPWRRASMNTNTQSFMSFFDATEHSRNDLESEDYHDYFNVVPSIHIPNSDLCSSLVSSSLDLNLQVAGDIIANPTYNGVSSSNGFYRAIEGPQESPRNSSNSNITLNSENGGGRTKKPGNFSETNSHHSEPKRHRTMPRSSCPPLKVRKEKLGDRIAALQRLVAPYGKTDTASVLTEAIGYIQFLHHQIQTLSVPYLESSNNKSTRTMQLDLSGRLQAKRDLRSRGLSLVPVSFASCFNTCN